MTTLKVDVTCAGETHTVVYRDGALAFPSHPGREGRTAVRRAATLAEFGNHSCGCAEVLRAWRDGDEAALPPAMRQLAASVRRNPAAAKRARRETPAWLAKWRRDGRNLMTWRPYLKATPPYNGTVLAWANAMAWGLSVRLPSHGRWEVMITGEAAATVAGAGQPRAVGVAVADGTLVLTVESPGFEPYSNTPARTLELYRTSARLGDAAGLAAAAAEAIEHVRIANLVAAEAAAKRRQHQAEEHRALQRRWSFPSAIVVPQRNNYRLEFGDSFGVDDPAHARGVALIMQRAVERAARLVVKGNARTAAARRKGERS